MSQATKNWIDGKYTDWRNRQKRGEDTQERFAEWIGVSRGTLNNWMNRGTTPAKDLADQIADKLGPEIYDLLGLARPDPLLQVVMKNWGRLAHDVQVRIAEWVMAAEARGTLGDSEKGVGQPGTKRKDGD